MIKRKLLSLSFLPLASLPLFAAVACNNNSNSYDEKVSELKKLVYTANPELILKDVNGDVIVQKEFEKNNASNIDVLKLVPSNYVLVDQKDKTVSLENSKIITIKENSIDPSDWLLYSNLKQQYTALYAKIDKNLKINKSIWDLIDQNFHLIDKNENLTADNFYNNYSFLVTQYNNLSNLIATSLKVEEIFSKEMEELKTKWESYKTENANNEKFKTLSSSVASVDKIFSDYQTNKEEFTDQTAYFAAYIDAVNNINKFREEFLATTNPELSDELKTLYDFQTGALDNWFRTVFNLVYDGPKILETSFSEFKKKFMNFDDKTPKEQLDTIKKTYSDDLVAFNKTFTDTNNKTSEHFQYINDAKSKISTNIIKISNLASKFNAELTKKIFDLKIKAYKWIVEISKYQFVNPNEYENAKTKAEELINESTKEYDNFIDQNYIILIREGNKIYNSLTLEYIKSKDTKIQEILAQMRDITTLLNLSLKENDKVNAFENSMNYLSQILTLKNQINQHLQENNTSSNEANSNNNVSN
ncbi:hypothetical protein MM26B8_00420 [Mycoplasmopsis meleagridis]|uniref:Lipoprotein n=1 Tax=Mycoplasmopsis meleagridis ATCC 25294 TaxID=1264554 RepID=A0A0F5H0R0_9BACT|nr:hypothetical protein [Mycoplasmopsis meleagridis]KKB26864.1 hypothetical protein MMELEA_05470 [Mycoplasmopsis meleagridis ATCC 25294]KUH47410.1 hypothetical protein ASB56_01735 [Mycoplasmopsis meleagridis]OAD18600.1 hypothetical protein MM26B8_00420 [Mycoplasmopsis meleagridis]VEU77397.1 Uncharacterised protein [Mycoplasmopsis meleagridis]